MQHLPQVEVTETGSRKSKGQGRNRAFQIAAVVIFVAMAFPLSAHASPFDTGFNNLQTLFNSRDSKRILTPEEVLAAHRAIAGQFGNQAEKVVAAAQSQGQRQVTEPLGRSDCRDT